MPTEAEVVRTIFRLYNCDGWGYKKIANYLTDNRRAHAADVRA